MNNSIIISLGETEKVSQINNPFHKDCITEIHLHAMKTFNGKVSCSGTVCFEKGNTKGEQKFKGSDMTDLFLSVVNFCKNLEDEKI